MIVRVSMRNFLSFGEETEISMIASRVTSHAEQVHNDIAKPINKLLKLSLIFGPNASGKSNIVKAIDFIRNSVTNRRGALFTKATHFKLHGDTNNTTSELEIDFKCESGLYRYGFLYNDGDYPAEWLYQIMPDRFKTIFKRNISKKERIVDWGESKFESSKDKEFYDFINRGTPDNRLLLTELRMRKLDYCEAIYKWFDRLIIIYPNTRRGDYLQMYIDTDVQKLYRDTLIACDTGISDLRFIDVKQKEVEMKIPEPMLADIMENSKSHPNIIAFIQSPKNRYIMEIKNNSPKFKEMVFMHDIPGSDEQVQFDFTEESDGTIRLFDLIPLLGDVKNDRIVIIDELDRSLHPMLTKHIINTCVSNSTQNESQLIATSHDVNLLDPDFIRRDAIWFVKKNSRMSSVLYSLEEFKTRNDKDLRNAYLEGLYGAIPYL